MVAKKNGHQLGGQARWHPVAHQKPAWPQMLDSSSSLSVIQRAPRNTPDSSFPRKREPSKIKVLESRIRVNVGFFRAYPDYPKEDQSLTHGRDLVEARAAEASQPMQQRIHAEARHRCALFSRVGDGCEMYTTRDVAKPCSVFGRATSIQADQREPL